MRFLTKRSYFWLVLSGLVIYIVNVFTTDPDVTNGGGNVGFLFFPVSIVFFFYFLKNLWRDLKHLKLNLSTWRLISVCSLIITLLFSYLEYQFVLDSIMELGGTPQNKDSRIYRFGWLNSYTNDFYFNIYTLLMLVSSVLFFYSIFKKVLSVKNS